MNLLDHYPGNKAAQCARIAGRFPWHSVYIEPFLGAGWVLRHKRPALLTIGIDRSPRVVAAWRASMPGVNVIADCGIRWMEKHGSRLPPDALVYIDAPYMLRTRGGRRYYGSFELDDYEHANIIDAAEALPCSVFISHPQTALYAARLSTVAGWAREDFRVMTRGGSKIETLWSRISATAATGAAAMRYPGRDHRDRVRLRRLRERWQRRFATMTPLDRAAVFESLARVMDLEQIDALASPLFRPTTPALTLPPAETCNAPNF